MTTFNQVRNFPTPHNKVWSISIKKWTLDWAELSTLKADTCHLGLSRMQTSPKTSASILKDNDPVVGAVSPRVVSWPLAMWERSCRTGCVTLQRGKATATEGEGDGRSFLRPACWWPGCLSPLTASDTAGWKGEETAQKAQIPVAGTMHPFCSCWECWVLRCTATLLQRIFHHIRGATSSREAWEVTP